MSTHDDLRAIALHEFAVAGYGATSLYRIAEIAGLSKSSVLYHFASKEALLEAAIAPAIDEMERILAPLEGQELTVDRRRDFIVEFVDLLLAHRNAVHIFVNQGRSLEDVPVVERANLLVMRIATFFSTAVTTTEDRVRFGIALGGAAYTLVTQQTFEISDMPVDETRAALVTIITELLAPVAARPILT